MYGIWCEVWGGVTGSRESWMKDNGKVVTFATLEEAQERATAMLATATPNRTANFRYTAEEYNG